MAGFVEVDIRRVVIGLNKMAKAARDLTQVFLTFKPSLRQDINQHFAKHEEPEGVWAEWNAEYQAKITRRYWSRVAAGPGTYLKPRPLGVAPMQHSPGALTAKAVRMMPRMLGKLRTQWSWNLERLTLEAKSRVPWAFVHQWGGSAGRGAKIPKRMFAWVSEEKLDILVDIIEKWLYLAWWRSS